MGENQDHDKCPRCGESESAQHVVECKGTGVDVTFALAVKKLDIHMTSLDAAPHNAEGCFKADSTVEKIWQSRSPLVH